jgi:hypothetical protein
MAEEIDAYVLVRSTGPGQLAKLFTLESTDRVKVRFHTRLVGRYDAFFALTAERIDDIQDWVIDDLRSQGRVTSETLVGIIPVPLSIKRGVYESPNLLSYVRIRVRRGEALRVLAEVQEVPGVTGANVVVGPVDLLVEVSSPTLSGLRDAILEMQAIDGIRSTESLLAAPSSPGSSSAS